MTNAKSIVFALVAPRKTRNPFIGTQPVHFGTTPRQYFMDIRLMPYIPDETILGRIEYIMQSDAQFDRAEIR